MDYDPSRGKGSSVWRVILNRHEVVVTDGNSNVVAIDNCSGFGGDAMGSSEDEAVVDDAATTVITIRPPSTYANLENKDT